MEKKFVAAVSSFGAVLAAGNATISIVHGDASAALLNAVVVIGLVVCAVTAIRFGAGLVIASLTWVTIMVLGVTQSDWLNSRDLLGAERTTIYLGIPVLVVSLPALASWVRGRGRHESELNR